MKNIVLVLGLIIFSTSAWSQGLPKNFGEVDPGKVYRSGQPINGQFAYVQKELGLKSLLVLHDSMPEPIKQELEQADSAGVVSFVMPISDSEPIEDAKLLQIMQFIKLAPKPLLIHCRAGANRTGLISAIYKNIFMNTSLEKAESDMLSVWWGHFNLGRTAGMTKYYREVYPAKVEGLKKALADY